MVLSSKITQLKNIFNLFPYCGGRFRWLKNQTELNKSREKHTKLLHPQCTGYFSIKVKESEWYLRCKCTAIYLNAFNLSWKLSLLAIQFTAIVLTYPISAPKQQGFYNRMFPFKRA